MTPPLFVSGHVFVDGVDLGTVGFAAARWDGDLTPAIGRAPTIAVPARPGERVTGAAAVLPGRTLTVRGTLLVDLPSDLEAAKDALLAQCAGGSGEQTSDEVVVALVPDGATAGRQWRAYLTQETTLTRDARDAGACSADVALTFYAPDPRAEDTTQTFVGLSTTTARVAPGRAPCWPTTTFNGPITAGVPCTLTLVDGANATVGTLTVTPSLSIVFGTEWIEVDHDAQTVVHVTASGATRTSHAAWFTSGTWLPVRPVDVVGGVNPGFVLSGGSGSGNIVFRKAYP